MTSSKLMIVMAVGFLTVVAASAQAAQTVHLSLSIDGTPVNGESTISSLGRADTIECISFELSVVAPRDASTGMATGRRTYQPIVIRKYIDKSTPLLMRALVSNQTISGLFRFFRPNPDGAGAEQHFFTVGIQGARISSIEQVSPDVIDPVLRMKPMYEEIVIVYQSITWTYADGGIEFSTDVGGRRKTSSSSGGKTAARSKAPAKLVKPRVTPRATPTK